MDDQERYALFERAALKIVRKGRKDSAEHYEPKAQRVRVLYEQIFGKTSLVEYARRMDHFLEHFSEEGDGVAEAWLETPLLSGVVYAALRQGQDVELLHFWLVKTGVAWDCEGFCHIPLEEQYYYIWEEWELLEQRFNQLSLAQQSQILREMIAAHRAHYEEWKDEAWLDKPLLLLVFVHTAEHRAALEKLILLCNEEPPLTSVVLEVFEALAQALCREAGVA